MKHEWIDMEKQKPIHPGVYEVWDEQDELALVSHWSGEFFGMCSRGMAPMKEKINEALEGKDVETGYPLTKWRKIASSKA